MRNTKEYRLAEMIVHYEDALMTANENAKKNGKLGVLPQFTNPSFHKASKFHGRVRKILNNVL